MLGGLLALSGLALTDVVSNRSRASVRNLVFVLVAGTSCVVVTGLPEVLFPELPQRLLMVLKAGLGPLAGALAVHYLGNWLGGMREDPLVYRLTTHWAAAVALAGIALGAAGALVTPATFPGLLAITAAVNMVPVLLGLVATIRAAKLGDPLARWMVLSCVSLALLVTGLYLRALEVPGFGLGTWIATAAITVIYFLLSTVLVLLRNRQNRQLRRLAGLQLGDDPATGLPTGSVLISKVEHAFWRTARQHGSCTVVCLHLGNLYELGETAGHGVENQILAAMAARIRRAAGFRCVVGLYRPRCFVVVISADKHPVLVNATVVRLRSLVARPLRVVGRDGRQHDFQARLGVGVVTLDPQGADPHKALNDAERQALGAEREWKPPAPVPLEEAVTGWDHLSTTPGAIGPR